MGSWHDLLAANAVSIAMFRGAWHLRYFHARVIYTSSDTPHAMHAEGPAGIMLVVGERSCTAGLRALPPTETLRNGPHRHTWIELDSNLTITCSYKMKYLLLFFSSNSKTMYRNAGKNCTQFKFSLHNRN